MKPSSQKPIIAVTRLIPEAGLKLLKTKKYDLRISPHNKILSKKELFAFTKGASAVLSLLTDKIDEAFFANAGSQLKIVANYAVGFDNIDLAAAKKHNVLITNTPGVLTHAVAEFTFAAMLACAKRIVPADRFTRAEKYHGWDPLLLLGMELNGKTLGVVGAGRIGGTVAKMAANFGMKIIYNNPKPDKELEKSCGAKFVSFAELLKKSDVVTLHVPLLPETRHLISAKELKSMKRTAILINTARGPIVDEKALVRALQEKHIFAAALDVYEAEPAIDCDTSDTLELRKLPNVILTPHIASATHETRDEMSLLAARNIIAVLEGKKPLSPVV